MRLQCRCRSNWLYGLLPGHAGQHRYHSSLLLSVCQQHSLCMVACNTPHALRLCSCPHPARPFSSSRPEPCITTEEELVHHTVMHQAATLAWGFSACCMTPVSHTP